MPFRNQITCRLFVIDVSMSIKGRIRFCFNDRKQKGNPETISFLLFFSFLSCFHFFLLFLCFHFKGTKEGLHDKTLGVSASATTIMTLVKLLCEGFVMAKLK
jgi:hypothetical protein